MQKSALIPPQSKPEDKESIGYCADAP